MIKKSLAIISLCYLLQGCASALVAGTVVTVSAVNDPRTIGSQVDDTKIELQATLELMKDDGISKHTNINVVSYNGHVLLVGQSPNQFLIDNANKIIAALAGVKEVHNQIKIGTPASLSTKSMDTWITTKVKSNLLTDEVVQGHLIKVVTENKEVYLMGIVDAEQANKAAEIASKVNGVTQVITVFQ